MKSMSIWLCLVIFGGGLVFLLLVCIGLFIGRMISADRLEELIEKNTNAEVSIASVEKSSLFVPKTLIVKELVLKEKASTLSGKNEESDVRKRSLIKVPEVHFTISLKSLLLQEISIQEVGLMSPRIQCFVDSEGHCSLESLFKRPSSEDRKTTFQSNNRVNYASVLSFQQGEAEALKKQTYSLWVKNAWIRDGEIECFIPESQASVTVENFDIELVEGFSYSKKSNYLSPLILQCLGSLSAKQEHSMLPPYMRIDYAGPVTLHFSKEDDEVQKVSEVSLSLELKESSFLDAQLPIFKNAIDSLKKKGSFGKLFDQMPQRALFSRAGEQGSLSGSYKEGVLTLNQPLKLIYGEWDFIVNPQSWMQLEEENHKIDAQIVIGLKMSELIRKYVHRDSSWKKYIPKEVSGFFQKKTPQESSEDKSKNDIKENRLKIQIQSQGSLKKPQILIQDFEIPRMSLPKDSKEGLQKKTKGLFKRLWK